MDNNVRARHAKELLNNPLFRELIPEMSESYFSEWVASEKLEEREEIHSKMRVLKDVVDQMNGIIAMHTGDGNA